MATNKRGPKKHASKAGNKRTKAFESKGLLKTQIQQRKRGQDLRKKIETRKMLKGKGKGRPGVEGEEQVLEESEDDTPRDKEMDVLLNGAEEVRSVEG